MKNTYLPDLPAEEVSDWAFSTCWPTGLVDLDQMIVTLWIKDNDTKGINNSLVVENFPILVLRVINE